MQTTFDGLMVSRGARPVDVASKALCSVDTIDRARKGRMPLPAILSGIASALRLPVGDVRAAILASRPKRGGRHA